MRRNLALMIVLEKPISPDLPARRQGFGDNAVLERQRPGAGCQRHRIDTTQSQDRRDRSARALGVRSHQPR